MNEKGKCNLPDLDAFLVGRGFDDPVHADAGHVDVVRVQLPVLDYLFHLGDRRRRR